MGYLPLITWNGYKKALIHFTQRITLPTRKLKVLDAGCGTGLVSFALAEKYSNIEIIEPESDEEKNKLNLSKITELIFGSIVKSVAHDNKD